MAYGQALRVRVLAFYDEGWTTRPIALRLRVSESWCRRVKQHRDRPPPRIGGGHFRLDATARQALERWVTEQPDATLEQLRQRVGRELGVAVSIGALWNTLRRMKLSLKKSR